MTLLLKRFFGPSAVTLCSAAVAMASVWFLLVLLVCGAIESQTLTPENEDDVILNPEKTTSDDLRVLVLQLRARVEALEKELEARGVFTAPRKGIYYIRFTGCVGDSGTLNAALLKNGVNMFAIYDTRGAHGGGSNGMPLLLEEGDRLSITLWSSHSIFDQGRLSTFSGFLVFPM